MIAEDVSCLAASQLRAGQGILNVGQIVGIRAEGAFVFVTTEGERWDATRGIQVQSTETRFLHCSDDVWVVG